MRTSFKTLLAAAGAGIVLASCAAEPYDYGYGDSGYPAYGYQSGYPAYGYQGYEPGYYVGPSVDYGTAHFDRGHDRHWRDRWADGDHSRPPQYDQNGIACCGPGSGPGGSPTQRDADRWGAGG